MLYKNVQQMYTAVMLSVSVTEARARMREVLAYVKAGNDVEFSQNGQVVAVLVHPSKLRRVVKTANTQAAEGLLNLLHQAQHKPRPSLKPNRAEQLVQELRAERDDWHE